MSLIQLIVVLIGIGVIMYLVNTYIPMQASIKKILNIAVVIAVIIWLLKVFGIFNLVDIKVG